MEHIVVLTGAGISEESGISTFRDKNGLWEKYPLQEVASIEGYYKNPKLVIDFYNERRKQLQEVIPNKAHYYIAQLEKEYNVTVITQNIDNLHEKAGSSSVIHLHGELTKVCSSKEPNNPQYIKELTPEQYNLEIGCLAPDGSQYRPFIVWFGEAVPKMDEAIQATQNADIFIIIGTSLNVYPAASLINYTTNKGSIYLIDPQKVLISGNVKVEFIPKKATEGMKILFEKLTKKQ